MRIWITGLAGCLGSNLYKLFQNMGHSVEGNDIVRFEEAWKLKDIDGVKYHWISTEDLPISYLDGVDMIFDCSIGYADRPFGTQSPLKTFQENIQPSFYLLEKVRRMTRKPHVVYPSSFNIFYGHLNPTISEETHPSPSTLYGWTKSATEQLYMSYGMSFKIPYTITRVGSAFGPKGRGDELPHKIILHALHGRKTFYLRSPQAKRLWTYAGDVMSFYSKFVEKYREFDSLILHLAGNRGDRILTNMELFNIIKNVVKSQIEMEYGEYEVGEIMNGKPVSFTIDSKFTREIMNWKPAYTLEDGLQETIEWFMKNLHYYQI